MKVCHMVLIGVFYDLIDEGKKTIEYRDTTEYWKKRLADATHICFHKGYTNITMTFEIKRIVVSTRFEIHLGERLVPCP